MAQQAHGQRSTIATNPTRLVKRHGFITPDAFRQKQLQLALKTACVQSGAPETAGSTIGDCLQHAIP